MKKAFEKFNRAKQYIAEKNYSELTEMLNEMLNVNSNIWGFGFHLNRQESFERITNYMILHELNQMIFTDPTFYDNTNFITLCCTVEKHTRICINYNIMICFDHYIMSVAENEHRTDIIKLILTKLNTDFSVRTTISQYMEFIVWYAAYTDNDTLLEEIYTLAENDDEQIIKFSFESEFCPWTWMYLEVIIEKKRYDLLDKIIELIFGKGNHDFVTFYNFSRSDMAYSELICLLYRRYCPEISDSKIAEQLINSKHFNTLNHPFVSSDNRETELNCIMKLKLKTNSVNCILALWLLSEGKYSKEYLYSLLKDKPVLYLNDKWIESCVIRNTIAPDKYEFLTGLLRDIPNITLSIDNYDNSGVVSFNINSIQLKELFSICNPVLTDKVCDNQLLNSLINSNSRQLKPLLQTLELDEKSKEDLIELCVKSKNNQVLNILNEKCRKG